MRGPNIHVSQLYHVLYIGSGVGCMSPHPVDLLYSSMVHKVVGVRCPGAGMLSINDVFLLASVQWIVD